MTISPTARNDTVAWGALGLPTVRALCCQRCSAADTSLGEL